MKRRRFLLSTGTLVGGIATAGCAGSRTDGTTEEPTATPPAETPTSGPDPATPTPDPTPEPTPEEPSTPETFSQRLGIRGGDYYELGAQSANQFELTWTATITDETPGPFDVYLFTPEGFSTYRDLVDGGDGRLSVIESGSAERIESSATRTATLDPGLHTLVVDNTQVGATTGADAADRLEVTLDAEMQPL